MKSFIQLMFGITLLLISASACPSFATDSQQDANLQPTPVVLEPRPISTQDDEYNSTSTFSNTQAPLSSHHSPRSPEETSDFRVSPELSQTPPEIQANPLVSPPSHFFIHIRTPTAHAQPSAFPTNSPLMVNGSAIVDQALSTSSTPIALRTPEMDFYDRCKNDCCYIGRDFMGGLSVLCFLGSAICFSLDQTGAVEHSKRLDILAYLIGMIGTPGCLLLQRYAAGLLIASEERNGGPDQNTANTTTVQISAVQAPASNVH
jgi:hypothetical protein